MGSRIVKTAIAVVLSIYAAQLAGLHSPNAAGLLAILGIEVTKKKGLRSVSQRIAASILSLLYASLLFWIFGFHIWVIGLFILGLYPLLAKLNLRDGVVTSSVVMFHLYAAESVAPEMIVNEIGLLVIGLGTATIINIVYMPKPDKRLQELRRKVEEAFSGIFAEFAKQLRDSTHVWSGDELLGAYRTIEEGVALSKRMADNALLGGETAWLTYFEMRRLHLDSIERMMQLVAQVYDTLPHGERLAAVFEELSEGVLVEYYTGRSELRLLEVERDYKTMPLPESRQEFELRSALLQLCVELDAFLAVSKRDKKKLSGNLAK